VVPPQLFKREIVRPKFKRRDDREQPPVIAPAPARPVQGGYASAGLLAWIALSKYVDHAPLYRLEQMSSRWGAAISRQTMADWVGITAEWLEPIYRQMHRELLAGGYVQADETPVRCNDPDEKRGGTTQGWLWVISRPGGDVVFDWRLSRRHGELTSLLGEYRGLLQSDAYAAYPSFARERDGVVWLGCWAHARRYWVEAIAESPKSVKLMLRLIGELYLREREWDAANVGAARAALRQEHFARPLRWLRRLAIGLCERAICRARSWAKPARICSITGSRSPLICATARAASTTTSSKMPSGPRPSERKTGSSSATPMPVSAPPSSTRSSSRANGTERIRSLISATCSPACPA
jgi:hypothetical protein